MKEEGPVSGQETSHEITMCLKEEFQVSTEKQNTNPIIKQENYSQDPALA